MIYMGIFQSRDQIGNLVVIEKGFPIDRVLVKTDSVGFPVLVWTRVSIGHFHYPQGKDYIHIRRHGSDVYVGMMVVVCIP